MSADRDDNRRFAPGNPGGPGRPRRGIEADNLAALSEVVPVEKWREVCGTAIDQVVSGDAKAREWIGSYLAGKPTGNALRRLAAAEVEAAPAAPTEESPAAGDAPDEALDMEARLTAEQSKALAALVLSESERDATRQAGVSPETLRPWWRDDPKLVAACGAAWNDRDARPRNALDGVGQRAVAILREALDGHAEPGELRAAVVNLLRLHEPASYLAATPAEAERQIMQRQHAEMLDDLLLPAPASWRNGEGDDEDEDDEEDECSNPSRKPCADCWRESSATAGRLPTYSPRRPSSVLWPPIFGSSSSSWIGPRDRWPSGSLSKRPASVGFSPTKPPTRRSPAPIGPLAPCL